MRQYLFNQGKHGGLNCKNFELAIKSSYDLGSIILHEGIRLGSIVKFEQAEVGLPYRVNFSADLIKLLNQSPGFDCLERVIRYLLLNYMIILMGKSLGSIKPNSDSVFVE